VCLLNYLLTYLLIEGWANASPPRCLVIGRRAEQRHRHFESRHTARSPRRYKRRGMQALSFYTTSYSCIALHTRARLLLEATYCAAIQAIGN
jgi:hypothetical protein